MAPAEIATRARGRPRLELDESALLDVAVQVFANEGFFAATVDEIARRAGTSKALLFRRYRTKDALFDLTVQHEKRSLTEHLFRAYETGEGFSVRGSIRAGVEATIDYAKRRPDGFRLLFQTGFTAGQGATPAWEEVRGVLIDRNAELVLRRLEALGAPGGIVAARMLSAAIVGASEHVARLIAEDQSVDPAAAAEALTELLTVGLTGLSRPALAALDRASGTGRERARR